MSKQHLLKIASFALLSLILSSLLMPAAIEKEKSLPTLNTKPKTIAIFKNGLGFFIKEGEVTLYTNPFVSFLLFE